MLECTYTLLTKMLVFNLIYFYTVVVINFITFLVDNACD